MYKLFYKVLSPDPGRIRKFLLVMKLVSIFMIVGMLQVGAAGYGQRITLKDNNATLGDVFEQITAQTGYKILCNADLVQSSQARKVDFKEADIHQILHAYFPNKTFAVTLKNKTIVIVQKTIVKPPVKIIQLQPIQITGVVTDSATGEPLVGVTVQVKGSNTGTTTDAEGRFSLSAPDDAVLIVSYIGYRKKEIPVNGQESITITLSSNVSSLNQLVVVGYGTQKKNDLTGAVSVVDQKMLENRPVTNVMNALQGAAPGLIVTRSSGQPGNEGYNLNIRGLTSVNGSNQPLVIIDGVEGDLSLLNPNDIASVSVLKDASAASIYGAKGANGVILITTKKGSVGKTTVTYSGLYSFNKPYNIPELLPSYVQASMQNESRINAGLNPEWTNQEIEWMKDPSINYIVDPSDNTRYKYYYNIDNTKVLLRDMTSSQSHNVSVSGGTPTNQYRLSIGYFTQDGVFKFGPDNYKRYNARLNLHTRFSNVFSLDSRLSYSVENRMSPSSSINGGNGLLYGLYTDRTLNPIFQPGSDSTKYAGGGGLATAYSVLKDGRYAKKTQNLLKGIFTLKAAGIIKGLDLRLIYSPSLENENNKEFNKTIDYYGTLPEPNQFSNNPNSIEKSRRYSVNNDVQFLVDYDWTIEKNHHFHVLGGYQFQKYRYDQISAEARDLISNEIPSLNFGINPDYPPLVGDDIQTYAFLSYFGRLNYSYKNRYLFQANIRNDQSSKLAPGHRSEIFPSFSAGWVISQEDWFQKSILFVNQLKFRGSWGKLGNADVLGNYDYIPLLTQGGSYPFNNVNNISIFQGSLASPQKTWETISTTDFGVDMAFFDFHLTASFDYFVKRNNNMLITVTLPATLGVDPPQTNSAKLETKGWDVSIGWKDKIGDFNYSLNFHLSNNKNKILEYAGRNVYSAGTNSIIQGLPVNTIFGYEADGYFSSDDEVAKWAFQNSKTGAGDIRYIDQNGDGVINGGLFRPEDHGDLVNLGNTSPKYLFGANLDFGWKGFDLSMFFQGVGKRKMLIAISTVLPFYRSWIMPWAGVQEDNWTPKDQNARFPRLYENAGQNQVTSSHWVQNAAYIMLKNLQFGYTFKNERILQKIGVSSARIFFSGQDIWEKTGMWFPYYNPEDASGVKYNYPFFHSYALGLNVTF